jgi:hypothetical protein
LQFKNLGISKRGFRSSRTFRNTQLRNSGCPDGLFKFWMGPCHKDTTDRYDKVREGMVFRKRLTEEVEDFEPTTRFHSRMKN